MKLNAAVLALMALQLASGHSDAQLSVDEAAVDEIFAAFDREDGPGCALGIVSEGKLVYARGYGMANLEHNVPMSSETVLRIGSTSKQFTAACAVLAEQQGALSLDTNIHEYLPELPDYGSPITMRHLLHHTSGIRDYLGLMGLAGYGDDDFYSPEAALMMIFRQQSLNFPTGTRHLYSNSGYFLVSVIIERTTGKTLAEFADEFIFAPLKMTSTHFHDDYQRVVKRRADGYSRGANGKWLISNTTLEMCGDGGVFTTVEDMLRWDSNFYDPQVGGDELISALQTHGFLSDGTELDYALGLTVDDYRGLRLVSHGGAFVGFRAEAIRFPEQRFSVFCFANIDRIDPTRLTLRVADEVLSEVFQRSSASTQIVNEVEKVAPAEPRFVEVEGDGVRRFASKYIDQVRGRHINVSSDGNQLILKVAGEALRLRPTSEFGFESSDSAATLHFKSAGLAGFWNAELVTKNSTWVLGPYIPWDSAAMSLEDYAGEFYSAELDTSWTLAVNGGQLQLTNRGGMMELLKPLALDLFESPLGTLAFERDAFQSVTHFRCNAGRVLGITFNRHD